MANSNEGYLNVIGLEGDTREKAKLKVLIDNPSGKVNKEILLKIYNYIKEVYGTDKCSVLWWEWNEQPTPSIKIITIYNNIQFLQDLWERIAGNYLIFLPVQFDLKKFKQKEKDEEEFIGMCLIKYYHLIVKSPDGYEVLYLTLNNES
ncbi:hypothetical protein ACFSCX_09765 [Bacillus salitolerans]|uniref:Uncharacterized protein n=1 Tax=Bacillus salitolerans TaxID=1437434 RepID=A0ABW4LPQ6_9BACI